VTSLCLIPIKIHLNWALHKTHSVLHKTATNPLNDVLMSASMRPPYMVCDGITLKYNFAQHICTYLIYIGQQHRIHFTSDSTAPATVCSHCKWCGAARTASLPLSTCLTALLNSSSRSDTSFRIYFFFYCFQ